MSEKKTHSLDRHVAIGTAWNLLGLTSPLVAAIAAIPLLVSALGAEKFGILAIVWIVTGYAGTLDLGLSRALTKFVSEELGQGTARNISRYSWVVFSANWVVGVVSGIVLYVLSPWLASSVFRVSTNFQSEAITALRWLALILPFVIQTSSFFGLLEAFQRFDLINLVRTPLGLLNILGPLAVVYFSPSVAYVVQLLAISRLVAWSILGITCLRFVQRPSTSFFSLGLLRPLLRFGGWLTLSSIVVPLMMYLDRILIAASIGLEAVAYYTVPYDVLAKLLVISIAVTSALLPALGRVNSRDPNATANLFAQGFNTILALTAPVLASVSLLAQEILRNWVGDAFASQGAMPAKIVAIGVLIGSVSRIPWIYLQSRGETKSIAIIHLLELPLFIALLWILIDAAGILGAATAWTARVTFDAFALYLVAARFDRTLIHRIRSQAAILLFLVALMAVPAFFVESLILRCVALFVFSSLCWKFGWREIKGLIVATHMAARK